MKEKTLSFQIKGAHTNFKQTYTRTHPDLQHNSDKQQAVKPQKRNDYYLQTKSSVEQQSFHY